MLLNKFLRKIFGHNNVFTKLVINILIVMKATLILFLSLIINLSFGQELQLKQLMLGNANEVFIYKWLVCYRQS